MQYAIKQGLDIFDVVLNTYGSLDCTVKLLQDNSDILTSIDYDLTANPFTVVEYDETFIAPQSPEITPVTTDAITEISFVAKEGQSVYDLCLMSYGSLDRIVEFAQSMGFDSLNNSGLRGQAVVFSPEDIKDKALYNYFERKGITMRTLYSAGGGSFDSSFDSSFQ